MLNDMYFKIILMDVPYVHSYLQSCPHFLYKIYEEMMQPIPAQLEGLFESDGDENETYVVPDPSVCPESAFGSDPSSFMDPMSTKNRFVS